MKILFLGTGNAWGLPSELCKCKICESQKNSQDPRDRRLRTSLYLEIDSQNILVDCGPDFGQQRIKYGVASIDVLLITHSHQDHIGGLDDLFPYMWASLNWKPILTYIHKDALDYLKNKKDLAFMFGSSKDKLLEEKTVEPGETYNLRRSQIISFKTFHGKFAPGSIGYIIDSEGKRIVYTSDFWYIESNEDRITEKPIDILIIEANWFNEPENNPWGHMSFQNSLDYLRRWNPNKVYYTHIGNEDQIPGDPMNVLPTKWKPKNPLLYAVPKNHREWDSTIRELFSKYSEFSKYCKQEDIISYDGLMIEI